MKPLRSTDGLATLWLLGALLVSGVGSAVEVHDMQGLEDIFGRYAPAGDCKRQPQILVDVTGLTFEVAGAREKVTNPEYAAAYGGANYEGITRWIFPYRIPDGYPILLTFNPGEQKGGLLVEPQDEGHPGRPKLSPLKAALVKGSPYARCK